MKGYDFQTTNLSVLQQALPDDFCLLCGLKPETVAVFIPDDPISFGGARGKTRLVRYALCKSCQMKPDATERVEKVILVALSGGGPLHAA